MFRSVRNIINISRERMKASSDLEVHIRPRNKSGIGNVSFSQGVEKVVVVAALMS